MIGLAGGGLDSPGHGLAYLMAPAQLLSIWLPLGTDSGSNHGYPAMGEMLLDDFYRFSAPAVTAEGSSNLVLELEPLEVLEAF